MLSDSDRGTISSESVREGRNEKKLRRSCFLLPNLTNLLTQDLKLHLCPLPRFPSHTYIIIAQGGLEEGHPGARICIEHGRLHLRMTLVEEVEGLREAAQYNGIDDAEGEHVASDHGVDHGHKGSSQANGSTEQ